MKNTGSSPPASGEQRAKGESGQGLAEYALILTFIAIVCVAALGTLGGTIAGSAGWTIP